MIAWLLAFGIWLWAGSGEALAGVSTSDAAVGSDTSEDAPAVSDALREVLSAETVTPEGSADFVVESYARDYSVTAEEAGRRLSRIALLQEAMGSIRVLEGSRVAGWGIEHGEDFGAWVWLAGDEDPSVEASRVAAAHDDVEIRTGATHTYEELQAAQDRIDPKLVASDPEISSKIAAMVVYTGIDMAANSVTVGIDSGSGSGRSRRDTTPGVESDAEWDLAAETARFAEALQEHTGVGMVMADATGFEENANFRAGEAMYTCTAGFAAQQTGGTYGVLTAGHCDDYQAIHGWVLPFVVGDIGPRADAQFHRFPLNPSLQLTNDYQCGANAKSVCKVTGTAKRVDMMGSYVCKTGRNTGVSCGEVTDITVSLSELYRYSATCGTGNTCDAAYLLLDGLSLKSCVGDSGSPLYDSNGIAYGILHGSTGTGCQHEGVTVIFSAIDEVEDYLDVKVFTAPPSALDAPQNLVGRFNTKTAGGLVLTWTPSEGAIGYYIYRRVSGSSRKYVVVGSSWNAIYVNPNLHMTPGTRYQYIVRAVMNGVLSAPSNAVVPLAAERTEKTPDVKVSVPDVKVSVEPSLAALQSLVGSLKPTKSGVVELSSGVELVWAPVGGAVKYSVYRRVSGSGKDYELVGTSRETSYVDHHSSLPPGFRYQYVVRAVAGSVLSEPSNDFEIDVMTSSGLRAEVSADGVWVDVNWKLDPPATKVDVQHFEVLRRKASETSETSYTTVGQGACCSYRDRIGRGPLPGVEYVYRVRPKNRYGVVGSWGSESDYATVQVPPPAAPQSLVGSLKTRESDPVELTSGVELVWEPVGGAAKYSIYRRVSGSGEEYELVGTSWRTSHVDFHKTLPPGFRYQYVVRAVVGSLLSEASNDFEIDVMTSSGLRAEVSADGVWVDVNWKLDPPATKVDVQHFEVLRRKASETSDTSYTTVGEGACCSYRDRIGRGPLPGEEYLYRVRPKNRYGVVGSWGSESDYATVRVPTEEVEVDDVSEEIEDKRDVLVSVEPSGLLVAPQSLIGSLKTREASGVELVWEPVGGAVQYSVYRRVSGSGEDYELVGTSRETSYVDLHKSLLPGFRYQYVVRAVAGSLLSEASNDFEIDVMTSSGLRAEVSADGVWVDVNWKLDPPATKVDVQHFEVLRRKASDTSYTTVGRVLCCSYRDRIGIGPLTGMEYLYRVRPKNRYGVVGSWGSSSDYTTVQVPTAKPRARMADPGTVLDWIPFRGVIVSWDDLKGEVTHFTVHRRAAVEGQQYGRVATVSASNRTFYDDLEGLTPGVEYYYRLKAVSRHHAEGHWGSRSNYAAVRLPALTGLQAAVSPGSASITVSWAEPVGDVAGYEVYRRAAIRGHAYTKIGDTTTASYSDPAAGLVPGAEYYYRVKAVSAAGAVGSWGTGKNYARVVAPAVGGLKATAVTGGVSVTWEQPTGDIARYKVYRRVAIQGQAYTEIAETTAAPYLDRSASLTPGTEYYYRIKPVGTNGVTGGWGPGPNYANIKYR